MKISASFKKNYPNLSVWITINIPKTIHKPKVWKAFLKYSELIPDDAKKALKKGSNPILGYKAMPRSNGMFSASKFPNKIFLAKSICDKFEALQQNLWVNLKGVGGSKV